MNMGLATLNIVYIVQKYDHNYDKILLVIACK
jgi:hypothetical protein